MHYITSLLRRLRPDAVVYFVGCTAVFVSCFGPLLYLYAHAPAGTQYRFADGFFIDYYHYLMKIKSGMMGYLGYYNRYTEIPQPVTYGHMIFPVMGYIASLSGFYRSDIVYLFSRIVSLLILFSIFYRSVRKLIMDSLHRVFVYVLFFTATSGYAITKTANGFRAAEPISFSGFYNALTKFPAPPHHLLPSALLLFVSYLVLNKRIRFTQTVIIFLIALVIGELNPLISIIGTLSFLFVLGYYVIFRRQLVRNTLLPVIVFCVGSAIPVLYYDYLFKTTLPWSIWATNTFAYTYPTDFWQYIVANVMFLPFLILSLSTVRKMPPVLLFLFGWGAIVPTVLYPIAAGNKLLSVERLLQAQQYIPLTIVSGYGVTVFMKKFPTAVRTRIVAIACVFMILFAALPWYTAIANSIEWKKPGYYNVFIPDDFIQAMDYLDKHSPSESVVLTGEYMSSVIPAFTHNRVLLGRGDVVLDYGQKLQGMYTVFGPKPDETFVRKYLTEYRVSYIIFGTDTPGFAAPYTSFPFLRPVFTSGPVTVVAVQH